MAMPSWCRLLRHWTLAAASRTFCTAGSNRPMRMAMMAMTTSSSISVKPPRLVRVMVSVLSDDAIRCLTRYHCDDTLLYGHGEDVKRRGDEFRGQGRGDTSPRWRRPGGAGGPHRERAGRRRVRERGSWPDTGS